MSERDRSIEEAFRQLGQASPDRAADLPDVERRVRARRTRRAAVGASLATLLVIGGVSLGVGAITGAAGGPKFAADPGADASPSAGSMTRRDLDGGGRSSGLTLQTADAEAVFDGVQDMRAYCTRGIEGAPGRLNIETRTTRDDFTGFLGVQIPSSDARGSMARNRPGPTFRIPDATLADDGFEVYAALRGAYTSSSPDAAGRVAFLSATCEPGERVVAVIDARLIPAADNVVAGPDELLVSGLIDVAVEAAPGFVDPTGELATDCSAIRSRDVTEFEDADVEVLGDGPYGTVTLGPDGTQFLVDFEDRSCREAPGIGRLITGP